MTVLAGIGVAGVIFMPKPGSVGNFMDTDIATYAVAVLAMLCVGCVVVARGLGKVYGRLTRMGVIVWGIVVYAMAMFAIVAIVPASVTHSVVRLFLGTNL